MKFGNVHFFIIVNITLLSDKDERFTLTGWFSECWTSAINRVRPPIDALLREEFGVGESSSRRYLCTMAAPISAYVVGYTGATGKALVRELARSQRFHKVVLIGRRNIQYDDPALQSMEQRIVDFNKLKDYKETFSGFDVAFCCLGTTRAEAGSAEAFKKVDYDYVLEMAEISKEGGTKHFHYVSSAGADKNSMFLYPQTKGLIEEALGKLNFPRLSIYRPRFLERGADLRLGEKFIRCLLSPVVYFNPVKVITSLEILSKAMITNSFSSSNDNMEIVLNEKIYELGSIPK